MFSWQFWSSKKLYGIGIKNLERGEHGGDFCGIFYGV